MKAIPLSHVTLATRLVREGKPNEAMKLIQAGLMENVELAARLDDDRQRKGSIDQTSNQGQRFPLQPSAPRRLPLGKTLEMLRKLRPPSNPTPPYSPTEEPLPHGATFTRHSFVNEAGRRSYKLYVPSCRAATPRPLIVMLHGCTQNADDFAAGTGMNLLGEEFNFVVAYPEQSTAANKMKCWSWFSGRDQQRGVGEPHILAGITQKLIANYNIDIERIYIAGFSAGAAMAAVVGATYPDLFAAIGTHSGLPYKAAYDVPSALAAMQNGHPPGAEALKGLHLPPAIVFHGQNDATVHSANGQRLFVASCRSQKAKHRELKLVERNGEGYSRTVLYSSQGLPLSEHWLVHGGGHAWSGGRPNGSFTDTDGPNASREMVRFFLNPELVLPGLS